MYGLFLRDLLGAFEGLRVLVEVGVEFLKKLDELGCPMSVSDNAMDDASDQIHPSNERNGTLALILIVAPDCLLLDAIGNEGGRSRVVLARAWIPGFSSQLIAAATSSGRPA